jgi:hypothetical protein
MSGGAARAKKKHQSDQILGFRRSWHADRITYHAVVSTIDHAGEHVDENAD